MNRTWLSPIQSGGVHHFYGQCLLKETNLELQYASSWQFLTGTFKFYQNCPTRRFLAWQSSDGLQNVFDYSTTTRMLMTQPTIELNTWGKQWGLELSQNGRARKTDCPIFIAMYKKGIWYASLLSIENRVNPSVVSFAKQIFIFLHTRNPSWSNISFEVRSLFPGQESRSTTDQQELKANKTEYRDKLTNQHKNVRSTPNHCTHTHRL
jgi:hypothetical protein